MSSGLPRAALALGIVVCVACRGRHALVALLLASGADVNRAAADRLTALHNAVAQRDVDLARLLLEAGADVAVRSARKGSEKGTPLEIARRVGSREMAALLIQHGAKE